MFQTIKLGRSKTAVARDASIMSALEISFNIKNDKSTMLANQTAFLTLYINK